MTQLHKLIKENQSQLALNTGIRFRQYDSQRELWYCYDYPIFFSGKFSSQYNTILGYKWNSAQRVTRNSQKSIIIESMGKFCSVSE